MKGKERIVAKVLVHYKDNDVDVVSFLDKDLAEKFINETQRSRLYHNRMVDKVELV